MDSFEARKKQWKADLGYTDNDSNSQGDTESVIRQTTATAEIDARIEEKVDEKVFREKKEEWRELLAQGGN